METTNTGGFLSGDAEAQAYISRDQASQVTLSECDFAALNATVAGTLAPNPALEKALLAAAKIKSA
jgi:hypothetical protein